MKRERGISILSTYARDTLLKESGEIISQQEGGPILFLQQALQSVNVPYNLKFGPRVDVEILITDKGEFGKIPRPVRRRRFLQRGLYDWVIVSTLLQEWDLHSINDFKGKVFVDLQGYVRDRNDFGKKQLWHDASSYADQIFCMKGTRQEVDYLPDSVRNNQKNRLLVITDGEKGVELFYQGNNFYVPTEEQVRSKDTIGAGDTFFGYFVASMYKGNSPVLAAQDANRRTAKFLKAKDN